MTGYGYLLIGFVLLLSACKPFGQGFRSSIVANEAAIQLNPKIERGTEQTQIVTRDWSPENIELKCELPGCPKALGNVFFAEPLANRHIKLHRCTAFMIAPDQVMTNGHCDYSDRATGYFVTRTDIKEKTWRKITQRRFIRYTQAPNDPDRLIETLNPDVVTYQLEKEIPGITALTVARGAPVEYTQLFGLVIDGELENGYAVKKIACTVRTHARDFPFALWEAPTLIQGYDCQSQRGNSGSPMFAKEGGEVEAILQGFGEPQEAGGLEYRKHWTALTTNLRCLDDAGPIAKPCTDVNQGEIDRRWRQYHQEVVQQIYRRPPEGASSMPITYSPRVYELVSDAEKPGRDFQVYFYPSCRRTDAEPTEVRFPIEQVELRFNEWADAKVIVTPVAQVNAKVEESWPEESTYRVTVPWPTSARQFKPLKDDEGKDIQPLPAALGGDFAIALPICPR